VAALGLKMTDLFADAPQGKQWYHVHATIPKTAAPEAPRSTKEAGARESQGPQTLEVFCAARRLDKAFLEKAVKVTEEVVDGRPAIVYPAASGHRVKFLDSKAPKYRWKEKGGKPYWYGLSRAKAHGNACLYLTNGEVSVWAADAEGISACCTLGGEGFIPPPGMVAELADAGFQKIRVVFDLDTPGRKANGESPAGRRLERREGFGTTVNVRLAWGLRRPTPARRKESFQGPRSLATTPGGCTTWPGDEAIFDRGA
jgi:hypothetical protein